MGRHRNISGGGGSTVSAPPPEVDLLLYATRTLTDTEIKNLTSTPIQIGPNPPAGKYHLPMLAIIRKNFNAGAYTNIPAASNYPGMKLSNANLDFLLSQIIDSPVNQPNYVNLSAFLGADSNPWILGPPLQSFSPSDTQGIGAQNLFNPIATDLPMTLSLTNCATPLTGGNPANTLTIEIWYVIGG